MATQATGARSRSASSKEQTSSNSRKKAKRSLAEKPVSGSKEVATPPPPVPPPTDADGAEGEYEVESIRAHQWSEELKEYEYLLKWKGYGEGENSWVPASSMNCWDLLQAYLSQNIYKNRSTVSLVPSTPTSSTNGESSRVKGEAKQSKSRQLNNRDILVSNSLNSTKSKGTLRLSSTDSTSSIKQKAISQIKDREKEKTVTAQFSTPKIPLSSSVRCRGSKRPPKSALTSRSRSKLPHNVRCILKQRKRRSTNGGGGAKSPMLSSPSVSPLPSSSGDETVSLQSAEEGSVVSIDDSFCLYLDSDEEGSSVSGGGCRSLSWEDPVPSGDRPSTAILCSPLMQVNVSSSSSSSPQQKRVNRLNSSFSKRKNGMVQSGTLSNGHVSKEMVEKRKNGLMNHLSLSAAENSSDSERRLRKRGHSSSSPTPSLEGINPESIGSSNGSHAEVSSTTFHPAKPCPSFHSPTLLVPPSPQQHQQQTVSGPLTLLPPPPPPPPPPPHRQSPNAAYQQELLEWQFRLNKHCRPSEAYILVENRIDEASIPWNFKYITSNLYGEGIPDPSKLEVSERRTCGCTCYIIGKRCGPKSQHCCPKMAGAEFPYSPAGKMRLPPGNPIYECNSCCSCPLDCLNRVVQRGRKINMCIFRTSNGRGWGVKTMEPIKPNTFVTEYVGEVVTTEEAERRGELYDLEGRTYLFDLDFNCDDNAFTIDAAHYGNISHFFNHSCNPNLRVYSVWIETLDERLPRIAFFSTHSISAGEELTFDYQMNQEEEGQVHCLCGQANCCGYLY